MEDKNALGQAGTAGYQGSDTAEQVTDKPGAEASETAAEQASTDTAELPAPAAEEVNS